VNSVNGTFQQMNVREVPGSLDSNYRTPFSDISYDFDSKWTYKTTWNYYGYGEGGATGPTAPRNFHGNEWTLAVHYKF
jgi:hypothetical protein